MFSGFRRFYQWAYKWSSKINTRNFWLVMLILNLHSLMIAQGPVPFASITTIFCIVMIVLRWNRK